MTTRWFDVADMMEGRAKRLGIPDDTGDLLLAAWNVLQNMVDAYDLPSYMLNNDAMFQTLPGHTTYPLPDDFGRFLGTTDQLYLGASGSTGQSGLFLAGGTEKPFALPFREAIAFRNQATLELGKPQQFTLSGRMIVLDPPPDTNGGANYIGQGVYMACVQRPDLGLEGDILLNEPTALVAATLYQIASDRGLPQAAALEKEHTAMLSALVNNAARAKVKLYQQRWPVRWTR
jgi:hypothetical protein